MQARVKKWFRNHEYGFLDNGQGPDILVRREALLNCQFLKVGANVSFEVWTDEKGLIARNVTLLKDDRNQSSTQPQTRWHGVMT